MPDNPGIPREYQKDDLQSRITGTSWEYGEAPLPPRTPRPARNRGGSVVGGIILLVVIVSAIASYVHSHQQVTITTCNPVLQTCYQTSYPVQTSYP